MKVLAVLLLCAFVAVQGRSAVEKSSTGVAALGENPWIVHLRVAVSTSGFLNTGAGTLISPTLVLSSAEATRDARFVWIRYGTVSVVNPSLVTESSAVTNSDNGLLSLINTNRFIETSDFIAPASIGSAIPESALLYIFGENNGAPGEFLSYLTVVLTEQDDGLIDATSDDGKASRFDLGAPLVNEDGEVVAVLVSVGDDSAGKFVKVSDYEDFIPQPGVVAVQPDESLRVKFVN